MEDKRKLYGEDEKQHKGDPMVEHLDDLIEGIGQKKAHKRHQRLKAAGACWPKPLSIHLSFNI